MVPPKQGSPSTFQRFMLCLPRTCAVRCCSKQKASRRSNLLVGHAGNRDQRPNRSYRHLGPPFGFWGPGKRKEQLLGFCGALPKEKLFGEGPRRNPERGWCRTKASREASAHGKKDLRAACSGSRVRVPHGAVCFFSGTETPKLMAFLWFLGENLAKKNRYPKNKKKISAVSFSLKK